MEKMRHLLRAAHDCAAPASIMELYNCGGIFTREFITMQ